MPYTYRRKKKTPLCRNTVQASSQRQEVEKGRGMETMFFSDALAVTDRNTSTANAWAHYDVSKGKNKERWTLCVSMDPCTARVPRLLSCGTEQLIPWLLRGAPVTAWERSCRSEMVSMRSWISCESLYGKAGTRAWIFPVELPSQAGEYCSQATPTCFFLLFKSAPQADYFDGSTMLTDPDCELFFFFTSLSSLSFSLSINPETSLVSLLPLSRVP